MKDASQITTAGGRVVINMKFKDNFVLISKAALLEEVIFSERSSLHKEILIELSHDAP